MRDLIKKWNNKFPYDHIWRRKYNIPYNSSSHREVSQVDIFFDLYEDKFIENTKQLFLEKEEKYKKYKETGAWFEVKHTQEELEDASKDLFERLKAKEKNG